MIVLITFSAYLLLRLQHIRRLEYVFGDDHVEYIDGFLNRERKRLAFSRISNVSLTQSVLERPFGLSSLSFGSAAGVALQIHNLRNAEELYSRIARVIGTNA